MDELLQGVVSENLATGDTPQRARRQGPQPHGAQQGGLALQIQTAHSVTFYSYCSIDAIDQYPFWVHFLGNSLDDHTLRVQQCII